jgi:hypothetical protein
VGAAIAGADSRPTNVAGAGGHKHAVVVGPFVVLVMQLLVLARARLLLHVFVDDEV